MSGLPCVFRRGAFVKASEKIEGLDSAIAEIAN